MEFSGKVVHGDAYGRTIGYPTINVAVEGGVSRRPRLGVYAGEVKIGGSPKKYQAAIVLSEPKTLGEIKVEAHLLDFSGDLYGQSVALYCGQFIRGYKDFSSEADLVAAIADDIKKIREILK